VLDVSGTDLGLLVARVTRLVAVVGAAKFSRHDIGLPL
jgi:hypothetical protein